MRRRGVALLVALAFGGAILCSGAFAQDEAKGETTEQDEMMEVYAKAGMVGKYHKHLAALEGTWEMAGKSWMPGGTDPMTWGGTSTKTLIMGGRYLKEDVESEMMGAPFTGVGVFGYNNLTEEYWHIWYDSMSTGMMASGGTCDEKGVEFTFIGQYDDPMTGEKATAKTILHVVGEDKHVFDYFNVDADGAEIKTMEIAYTRK